MNQVFKVSFMSCWMLFAGMIACVIFSCGGLMAFGLSPVFTAQANKVENLPTTTDVAVGEETVLTGTLVDNPTVNTDPQVSNIAEYELVAYQVEHYERGNRSTTGRNRTRSAGSWRIDRRVADNLTLDVNGTEIVFEGDAMSLNGTMEEFRVDDTSTLTDGSLRVRGFRNGAQVTIVAERTINGTFEASEMYGGTRDQMIANSRLGASITRVMGFGMMGISTLVVLIFGAVFLLIMLRRR